jgi:hypothetical protein
VIFAGIRYYLHISPNRFFYLNADISATKMTTGTKMWAIVTVVAVVGAFALAAALTNITPVYAKITPTCDGEPGDCPGRSDNPGQGHEDTGNQNPSGKLPPGQNK